MSKITIQQLQTLLRGYSRVDIEGYEFLTHSEGAFGTHCPKTCNDLGMDPEEQVLFFIEPAYDEPEYVFSLNDLTADAEYDGESLRARDVFGNVCRLTFYQETILSLCPAPQVDPAAPSPQSPPPPIKLTLQATLTVHYEMVGDKTETLKTMLENSLMYGFRNGMITGEEEAWCNEQSLFIEAIPQS